MNKKSLVTLTLAVAFLSAAFLPAQMEPAPYLTLHFDTVDPAQMMAFEENNKAWVEAFTTAKVGKDNNWRGYQSGFTYAWVSDLSDFAYLDGSDAREKMLNEKMGEGVLEALVAGGAGTIVEHHNEIWKYQAEMTYLPEGFSPEGMGSVNVTTVTVRPSKGTEYQELVKEVVAGLKEIKAETNFSTYSIPYGAGSYAFVSWGKDRAALHSGPDMRDMLIEAFGEEKTQEMYAGYLSIVSSEEDRDWRVRDDISYVSDGEMMEKEAE